MTVTDLVEGPIEKVSQKEIENAMGSLKSGKATGPSEVNIEMIKASGAIGVDVMTKLCQQVLDGNGMPREWRTSVLVPIYKGKGDVLNCGSY